MTGTLRTLVLIASTLLCLHAQSVATKDVQSEIKGIPPRATAADYQAQAQAGNVTIGAEFTGHSVPTPGGPLTTENYVVVETALFGPADAHVVISPADFSLRLNGKKPVPAQPYGLILSSLKD